MSRHNSRVFHNQGALRRKARIHVEQLEARNLMSFTPKQIVHAYGFDRLSQNGSGQTIAIIDAYYDPSIKSDLSNFSSKYGLAQLDGLNGDGTFTQVDLTKAKVQSPPGDDWTLETALDVEWAHAVAPKANIVLVEAKSDLTDSVTGEPTDLLNAVDYANKYIDPTTAKHVRAVSMSWGVSESSFELGWDSQFFPANNGITYIAASGDSGAGTIWPAVSPNVVAVGGTTLKLTSTNTVSSETGWGNGILSFYYGGSGGGISTYEPLPSYQSGITTVSSGFKLTSFGARLSPDVSYDANPNTGFVVLDAGTLYQVGGTSAGAPQWAALVALADQGRGSPLSSNQTLSAIYSSSNASGFRDITTGPSTGAYDVYDSLGNFLGTLTVQPQTGYDMVTGQGSPKANILVPNLIGGVGVPAAAKTAALTTTTSTGTSGSGPAGKGGAQDMPMGSNGAPGTTNTPNTLSTQGLISASLVAGITPAPVASFVQARPATLAVAQPAPAVLPGNSAAIGSSARYSAISGSSDPENDGFSTVETLKIMPAEYQEDRTAPATPSRPGTAPDTVPMTEPISPSDLDAYFIEGSLTDSLTFGAPIVIADPEQPTPAAFEPAAGVFGTIALLGGFWSTPGLREEKKRPSARVHAV